MTSPVIGRNALLYWRYLAIAHLAAIFCASARAQFHTVELRALSRGGAQAGTTFDLSVLAGERLDEVDTLYFSHPDIAARLKTLDPRPFTEDRVPQYGHFTVTVPGEVPLGRYEVRAGGRHGVSNPRAFLVSRLANQTVAGVSHDAKAPTMLPHDTISHAKATAANIDYFGLEISEGQSLKVELFAQRVDSRMIGQLTLYDPGQRVVAARRGADDVDPELDLENLIEGQYVLAIHDFLFRGGDEFHYQIVAQQSGAAALVDSVAGVQGQLPRQWPVRACTALEQDALVATSESDEPRTIDVPSETTHWFSSDGSDSVFVFSAQQGQQLAIDITSQRLLEATDARLIVQRIEPQPSGPPRLHDVLNADDSQDVGDAAVHLRSKDPTATFTAPETASYRLTVRDLDEGQTLSERQKFKLRIGPPNPGFDLVAYRMYPHNDVNQSQPLGSKLFRAGAEAIRVLAIRRDGWTGPIKLAAENLPPGVTCRETVIGSNQDQAELTLTANNNAAGATGKFQVVGRSDDGTVMQQALPVTILWGSGGGRNFIRSRISSDLYASVSSQDLSPLTITLGDGGDGNVLEVHQGESLMLPVKLTRREGGQAACVLRPRDLPAGVTAGEVTVPADQAEANLDLTIAAGTVAGTYSLWLQAETRIKLKPNPQALARAQQYRSHLQSLQDDPARAADVESIQSAVAAADERIEAAKAAANEQELTVFIPSSNATIRVVEP